MEDGGLLSRPVRARELKHIQRRGVDGDLRSRPLRARELKPLLNSVLRVSVGRAPCGRVN